MIAGLNDLTGNPKGYHKKIGSQNLSAKAGCALCHPVALRELKNGAFHVVDLENLMGEFHEDWTYVQSSVEAYKRISGWQCGDAAIISGHPKLVTALGDHAHDFRVKAAKCGVNGADLALMQIMLNEPLVHDCLLIGSGDGAFAPIAENARSRGIHVVVLARPGSLSTALKKAACEVRWLESPSPLPLAA